MKKKIFKKNLDWRSVEISEELIGLYEKTLFSGITNTKILSILKDVKKYFHKFRPNLISFSCGAVGGKLEDTYEASLIVTLAGTGIGIHDDIIDKSISKNSGKTIPAIYDFEDALLIGDLLIVKGLTAIQQLIKKSHYPKKIVEVIETVQQHYFEICEGIFIEKKCRKNIEGIFKESHWNSIEGIFNKIKLELKNFNNFLWKFASDGEACTRIGALLGHGNKNQIEVLGSYGRRLCYVFRLAEEVNDVIFSTEENLLRRLKFESIPLPILYASIVSKKASLKLRSCFKNSFTKSDIKPLINSCIESNAFEYVRNLAKKNITEGIDYLSVLPDSKFKAFLTKMIRDSYYTQF